MKSDYLFLHKVLMYKFYDFLEFYERCSSIIKITSTNIADVIQIAGLFFVKYSSIGNIAIRIRISRGIHQRKETDDRRDYAIRKRLTRSRRHQRTPAFGARIERRQGRKGATIPERGREVYF